MTIKPYTADRFIVDPRADRILNHAAFMGRSGRVALAGFNNAITVNGLSITIGTSMWSVQGALFEVTTAEIIAVPPNFNGYLVAEVNLDIPNESIGAVGGLDYVPINNQIKFRCITTAPVMQNLWSTGRLAQVNLGTVTSTGTTATYTAVSGGVNLDFGATAVWPVNSIYESSVNTSPASLFGGTWVQQKLIHTVNCVQDGGWLHYIFNVGTNPTPTISRWIGFRALWLAVPAMNQHAVHWMDIPGGINPSSAYTMDDGRPYSIQIQHNHLDVTGVSGNNIGMHAIQAIGGGNVRLTMIYHGTTTNNQGIARYAWRRTA